MKNLRFLILLACLFSMTSCIDIIEELSLQKGGQGKYVITMDMSSLMEEGMRDMLKGMAGEEGASLNDIPSEMDTTMYFSNAPDSVRSQFEHPEILDKVSFRTQISEANELMRMTFSIDFDELKQIDYFLADIDKMQGDSGGLPGGGLGGGGGLFPTALSTKSLFSLAKRKLTRSTAPQGDDEKLEGEELAMMKMFFADASYTNIYHLPGKVKKTTMPNAQIDGKKLTIVTPLMDIMEGKAVLDGEICFKKR